MHPSDLLALRRVLPDEAVFHYYPDRDAAWLLAHHMGGDASVSALKTGPLARYLDRSLLRPMVAACGGRLSHRDVLALAHADRAMRMDRLTPAGLTALEAVYTEPWQDYRLSFDTWTGPQLSRLGGNLVVQLGFPSDHAELLGRHFTGDVRDKFEETLHPVRTTGRPTLAWARLDIDTASGTALVEEIQSDWLRFVADERRWLEETQPQSRDLRLTQAYEREVIRRYAKSWPSVMMLAVLMLLRETLGVRTVWMHQPEPGAVLKGITWGGQPPRSLYTRVPKRFGFVPVRDLPPFLERPRDGTLRKILRTARKLRGPLFWKLAF